MLSVFVSLTCSACVFISHSPSLVHLFSLTPSVLSPLPLACPLPQLLWPLNITQAVSAKLWMSLDTYSTQTPFGISICTEPISIFIAGRAGARLKPAVRISRSLRHRNKRPRRNYVCSCKCALSVCLCLFPLKGWLTKPWRLSELNFDHYYHLNQLSAILGNGCSNAFCGYFY